MYSIDNAVLTKKQNSINNRRSRSRLLSKKAGQASPSNETQLRNVLSKERVDSGHRDKKKEKKSTTQAE